MTKRAADFQMTLNGRDGVWSIAAWCAQYGCSAPYFYELDPAPYHTKLGRLVRITESPHDYVERVRQLR